MHIDQSNYQVLVIDCDLCNLGMCHRLQYVTYDQW